MNTQSPDTSAVNSSNAKSHGAEFSEAIQVPDTSYLLAGEYSQSGFDLVITNPSGHQFVVADYFAQEPPSLVLASGVGLTPEMVRALLHRPFTEDLLFAGPASAASGIVIGSVKFVLGRVIAISADSAERQLKKGDKLYQGDEIRTDGRGFIRAEMNDGTKFNLGKNGRAVLENFEFDESARVGNFEAKVYLGGFHYKSGKIGTLNPGLSHSQIKTPSAFISIRGSEADGFVGPDGATYVIHTSGILEITDINGLNAITLEVPGHTSVIVMNGAPGFFESASAEVMQLVRLNLPPVDPTLDDGTPEPEDDPGQGPAAVDPSTDEFTDDGTGTEEPGDETGTGDEGVQDDPDAADDPVGDDTNGSGNDEPDSTLFDQDVFDDNFVAGQDGDDSGSDDAGQDGADDPQQDPPDDNQPVDDEPIEPEPELPPTHPPGAENDALAVTAGELTDLTDLVLENDGEPGQSAVITGVDAGDLEGSLTFEDGTLSYIADEESHIALAEGESTTEEFEYTAGVGQITDTAEVTLTVIGINDAPVSDDVLKVINEDQFRYFNESDFIFDDVDNNAALESVLVTRLPETGRLYFETTEIRIVDEQEQEFDIVVQVEAGQRFTVEELTSVFYVPLTHVNGEDIDRFEFKVSDGMADSEEEYTFSFDALPVQDAPFPIGDHYTIDEDTLLSVSAVDGVLANDIEVDGESLSVVDALFLTPDATPMVLFADGAFEFATPNSDLLNSLSAGETFLSGFSYAVSDGVGGTSAGTVTITVTGVNDAPVSDIALQHADTISGDFVLDLLDPQHTNDPDRADQLIIEAVSQDTASGARDLTNLYSVTNGVLNFDTSIFSDLGPGESEILVFDYSVNDQRGADNSVIQSSVSIQVTDGNFAPVAVDDSAQTDEDTPLTLLPLANDSDANPIDQLTLQSVDAAGLEGEVTLSTDGQSVLYTPPQFLAPGESLDDTFSYVVSDGILTDVGTVTITVSGLNDAPQAIPNPQLVPISATAGNVVIPLTDIFADPEPNSVLTVESIDTTGTIGTVSIGSVVYNPAGNFGPLGEGETGIDSFGVTVSDQHGALGSANVILSITGVNDLPTAVADSGTLFATTNNAAFVTGNVLANDTDPDTTDVLQVVGFDASGALGVVTNNGDGSFNYDPAGQFGSLAPGSVASDQFSYTISDGHGGISSGVVTINITGANSPPSGLPVIVGIAVEGSTLTADTSAIADPDGLGVFSYQWFANGVPIPGATAASFAPDQATVNTNVTVDVSYTDGGGTLEVLPSAPVLIANLNDPPTGSVDIDNLAPSQGNMLSVTHTLSDADGLSGPVNYQWQSSPDSGTTWNNVAVGNTLIMTQAEVGKIVRVAASYTDDLGTPETVTSVPTASVININDPPLGNVTITGTAAELSTLTADTSSITDLDGLGTFSYQWFVNSVPISGAVLATFTPTQSEVGGNLTVDVTYTDGFGATETLLSPPTPPVANVNDPPGGTVDIDNLAPFQGDTLNVSETLTDPDGLTGPITFQWQGSNDAGSTWFDIVPGPSLIAGEPEVGLLLRVRADYTDDLGTFEQVFSSPTAAVQNVNDSPVLNSAFPLPPIDEGFVASVGIPLSGLVLGFDPDAGGSIAGVAVVSNPVSTEGSWEYTTDGGSTWGVITAVDDVGNALALDYTLTDMRFNPGFQFSGTVPGLEVRLLDDSFSLFSDSASTPQFLNTSSRGGTTGISTAKGTLTIDVDPVNDPPVITAPSPISGLEDFNIGISGLLVTDADAGTGQLVVDLNVGDGSLTAGLPAAGVLVGYGVSMLENWGAFSVPADTPIYVRFNLTGATFDSVVQANQFTVYADLGPVFASSISSGGNIGDSFVIFQITSPSANPFQDTSPFDFSVDSVNFTAATSDLAEASMAIYSDLPSAIGQFTSLFGPVTGIDLITGDLELLGSQVNLNNALGSLSYLGAPDFNGSDSLFVHVDDQGNTGGMFQTDTGSFTITVTPANDLPVLDFPLNDAGVMRGYPVSIPIAEHFFDADGDPLTFGFSPTLPSGLAFSGGFITGTMTTTVTTSTSTSVTVSVDDGGTPVTDTFQLTIVPFMTNTPPMGSDNLVSTDEDIPYTFERQDFGYSDPESNPFTSVKITSLETVGTLQLNSVDVTLNQVITIADINLGLLTFSTLIPNDSANNYDQFQFTVNDGTLDSTTSNTMTIDVWAVNDPPMIFSPGGLVLNEDQTLAIPDLTIWDDDAGAGTLQLELSVGNGQLAVDATSVSVTGFDTNVLTPLGVNIAPGTTFYVRYDLANAGFDAALVPGDLSVFEGPNQIFGSSIIAGGGVAETMVIFSLINTVDPLSDVSDLDLLIDTYGTFGSTASVTRRVYDTSANAIAGGPTGQLSTTSQALGASYLMITGDLSGLSNALISLTYRPYADFNGTDTLSVTLDDQGNTDGPPQFASTDITLNVGAVDDPPVILNASIDQSTTINNPLTLDQIFVDDVDSTFMNVNLTLANPLAGSLNTPAYGGATSSYVAGTGAWSASGTPFALNIVLSQLVFTPAFNFTGSVTLDSSVDDGGAPVTDSLQITVASFRTDLEEAGAGRSSTLTGTQSIALTGNGETLAFADSINLSHLTGSHVDRVEVLQIADGETQVIELDTDAIKHLVDGHNALTGIANSLVITGDGSDLVRLYGDYIANGEMQLNVDGSGLATYNIYTDGDASVLLGDGLTLEVNYLDGQLVSFESGEVITVNEANSITEDPGSMFSDSLDMDNLENLLALDSHSSVQDVNILDIFAADDAFSMEDLLSFAATDSVGAETGTGFGNGQGHEFMSEPVPANGNELASALGGSNVVPFTHSDFATPVDYTDVNLA